MREREREGAHTTAGRRGERNYLSAWYALNIFTWACVPRWILARQRIILGLLPPILFGSWSRLGYGFGY